MTASRKRIRHALAEVLDNEVTAARAVYGFQKAKLKGQTPVICVTSAGTARAPMTMQGDQSTCYLDINVFVLYTDGGSWTEEQAEDKLDDIEEQIAAVVAKYRKSTSWGRLAYVDRSDARTPIVLEGITYLHEVIPLEIQEYT